ncbi:MULTISPECIES: hypothetical protein [unclassified Micromonospora]|uniref:hypothetical protein n=1 Tax=unclassified Micromonospora TaxID=2617518 RepID=UPI00332A359C
MRLSRIIMALAVGLAVVAAPSAAAAAQPQPAPGDTQPPPYVPGPATLAVSPTTVVVGQTCTLIGTGWTPGETVVITVGTTPLAAAVPGVEQARRSNGELVAMAPVSYQQAPQPNPRRWEVTADGEGNFRTTYTPRHHGTYTFRAEGETSDRVATATLTVLKKDSPAPPLPVTGDSLSTPMKFGGGLVGAGAVLLLLSLAWRKRHRLGMGAAR